MTQDKLNVHNDGFASHNNMPPGIPGLIEGTMTMHRDPRGDVSFRVLIDVGNGSTAERGLLELVIAADHLVNLSRGLANRDAEDSGSPDSVLSLPCRIGFCPKPISSAA